MTMIIEWITLMLVLAGVGFCCVAAFGLLRMPDLYNRMQSATKAGTLGIACVASAAGIHFATTTAVVEAVLVVLFFFATAPVGSHLIARAAYGVGVPLDRRTTQDDLSTARAEAARRRLDRPLSPHAAEKPGTPPIGVGGQAEAERERARQSA